MEEEGSPEERDGRDIYLPNHVESVSHIAVDIGGSLAKVVYFTRTLHPQSAAAQPQAQASAHPPAHAHADQAGAAEQQQQQQAFPSSSNNSHPSSSAPSSVPSPSSSTILHPLQTAGGLAASSSSASNSAVGSPILESKQLSDRLLRHQHQLHQVAQAQGQGQGSEAESHQNQQSSSSARSSGIWSQNAPGASAHSYAHAHATGAGGKAAWQPHSREASTQSGAACGGGGSSSSWKAKSGTLTPTTILREGSRLSSSGAGSAAMGPGLSGSRPSSYFEERSGGEAQGREAESTGAKASEGAGLGLSGLPSGQSATASSTTGRAANSRPGSGAGPWSSPPQMSRMQSAFLKRRSLPAAIPGGRLNFIKFETDRIEDCIQFLRELIERSARAAGVTLEEMRKAVKVMATGGGAHLFHETFEQELGVEVRKEDEMGCLITGLNFITLIPDEVFSYSDELVSSLHNPLPTHAGPYLDGLSSSSSSSSSSGAAAQQPPQAAAAAPGVAPQDLPLPRPSPNPPLYAPVFDHHPAPKLPCLLVNIGSGVSLIKVDDYGKYERVSGTSLGGGTLWGLLSLLTDASSFDGEWRVELARSSIH